jgi:glycosyltransferase involved in cell wall biosynthesis
MDDVVVVVPAYNEAVTIGTVVADLRHRFGQVVCVDDGSRDDTAHLARAAGAVVVRHAVNLGQGAALQTGFEHVLRSTDAEFCVTFDADGQHLVDDAVRMVEALRQSGSEVALASRFTGRTEAMPWRRRELLRAAVWFTRRTTGLKVSDTHNGLRVLRRSALRRMHLSQRGMAYASELQAQVAHEALSYVEVPTTVLYTDYSRAKGQRNINAVNIVFDLAAARLRALP